MSTPQVDITGYDRLGCLHDMFVSQVKKTPKNVAVVNCDGSKITYEDLDKLTDLLSNKLRSLGVKKNQVVGILMERSLEYTVSYISSLKAGAAYLPIEVSWPAPLVESVLKDATPAVICAKEAFSSKVRTSNVPVILLDGDWSGKFEEEQRGTPLLPPVKTSLDDIAYVVYSSGTTGTPKGIQCPHRGAVFSYTWRHRAYPYCEDDREACNVFFVWEMFRPLAQGLPMYIIPDDVIYDPPKLANFIQKNRITRMLFTPSLLQALLEYKGVDLKTSLKSMRQIVYCGEVVTMDLRDRVAELLPWIQQLNLYSISECHDVACADLSDMPNGSGGQKFCPVGKVFPGVHIVVMDENLNVKPIGEPGEIYIGGPGLAIGYLNRPDLNAARFIPRPAHVSSAVGERLYRSGDWGCSLADGGLAIHGRCDSMVKIRGYTIEMEAVRLNLMELPGVSSTCVQVFGMEGEEKSLVAFLVLEEGVQLSHREIRTQLKKKLPFYMIPSRFIIVERIPVMEATGKLDTKALAAVYAGVRGGAGVEVVKVAGGGEGDVTAEETRVAHVWSRLLNISILDTEESFFDLGGHSLLAAALASNLSAEFGVSLSTTDIFKNPTISSQALLVTDSKNLGSPEKLDLHEELNKLEIDFSRLDSEIRIFWQTVNLNPGKFSRASVLLTGATGYVGCFLLEELVQHTQTTVYCLVRESPDQKPLDRLLKARTENGLRGYLPVERVIPIKGDVSLTNFGLSKDVFSALSLEVDVVIHAAAQVNLILPFSALYTSNVLGTHNVLTFALNGKIKPVHYISTNAVFPDGVRDVGEDVDMSVYARKLNNGYGQTKWVAEQMVLRAAKKGFPTAIYRCGNVGGSRLVAGWNSSDFNLHMIKGVCQTGCAPDMDWQIELTPVDFVSRVIVNLVSNLQDSNGKIFHVINSSTLPCKKLWKLMERIGYKATQIPFPQWKKLIIEESEDGQLSLLRHLLANYASDEASFLNISTFKQENLVNVLQKMNLTYPQLTEQLFISYFEDLASCGILPKPVREKVTASDSRLAGKVVVVTGASSGIGEGIARALARAGATVVLAARRRDRLQAITEELRRAGGVAHAVQLDVCNAEQVSTCIEEIERTIGEVEVLVNNAGVMYYQLASRCDLARWRHMVDVNVTGTLNCVAAVLARMVARGSGHIVNISSDAARKPFPGLAVYSGTKFFVHCFSGAVRAEVAASGVKVTDIQPGDVASELHNNVTDPEAELAYDWSSKVPILKPSDVGEAVLFALSQPAHCAINEILLEPQLLPL